MRRSAAGSVAANPVLVGAVTLLVTVVAVFLAYNANQGLPFVPMREYRVQLANGANLLPGNEVKIGGQRVGMVERLEAVPLAGGDVGAELYVKLDETAGDVPVDSTWRVRPRSPLGLKYVELVRGRSEQVLESGATVPASQTSAATELNEYQGIFDERTRRGVQQVLEGTGNTFALRGADLNRALEDAPRLMRHLEPVARSLAAPGTNLRRFVRELGDAARIVAPVAESYARSFTFGAQAFEAWSRHDASVSETIRESVPTLRTATRSLRVQRPMLVALRDNAEALERLAGVLPTTAPVLSRVLEQGRGPISRSPAIYRDLGTNLEALGDLVRDPATTASFVGVMRLGEILKPVTRHIGPFVTVCNYFNYSFTHLGEHLTEPDVTGTAQRTLSNQASRPADPTAPSIGSLGATRPVNGEPTTTGVPMHLHAQPYGAAISHDGEADCESGQRGYMRRLRTYGDKSLNIVTDPRIPGNQGTTYTGRPRVPTGQTFDRNPQIGPPFPKELDHP